MARVAADPIVAPDALGWTTILRGPLPTAIVARTVSVRRSTTDTSLEPSSVTNAVLESAVVAIQCGCFPTATTAVTVLSLGRTTASSPVV